MTKTLEELAMEYALVIRTIPDRPMGVFTTGAYVNEQEAKTQHLHYEMSRLFGVYETQEAIKRAHETLKMVLPDEDDDQ